MSEREALDAKALILINSEMRIQILKVDIQIANYSSWKLNN